MELTTIDYKNIIENLCHIKKTAASRFLSALQKNKKIIKIGSGNNFKYILFKNEEQCGANEEQVSNAIE